MIDISFFIILMLLITVMLVGIIFMKTQLVFKLNTTLFQFELELNNQTNKETLPKQSSQEELLKKECEKATGSAISTCEDCCNNQNCSKKGETPALCIDDTKVHSEYSSEFKKEYEEATGSALSTCDDLESIQKSSKFEGTAVLSIEGKKLHTECFYDFKKEREKATGSITLIDWGSIQSCSQYEGTIAIEDKKLHSECSYDFHQMDEEMSHNSNLSNTISRGASQITNNIKKLEKRVKHDKSTDSSSKEIVLDKANDQDEQRTLNYYNDNSSDAQNDFDSGSHMIPAQIARQNSMPDSIDELSSDSSGLSDLELTNSNTEIIYEVDLSTLFYNSTDDSSTELFNPEYFGDISGETENSVPKLGEQEVSSEQDEDDQEIIPFEFLQKTDKSGEILDQISSMKHFLNDSPCNASYEASNISKELTDPVNFRLGKVDNVSIPFPMVLDETHSTSYSFEEYLGHGLVSIPGYVLLELHETHLTSSSIDEYVAYGYTPFELYSFLSLIISDSDLRP